jgi:hypothetical protein
MAGYPDDGITAGHKGDAVESAMVYKTVGIPRGSAPHPGPLSEMEQGRVISSPGQAKPYPRTSRDGKGSLRSTLRADPCRPRRTRGSSESARPRR